MVTSEFFEQGDRERSELKLTPSVSASSRLRPRASVHFTPATSSSCRRRGDVPGRSETHGLCGRHESSGERTELSAGLLHCSAESKLWAALQSVYERKNQKQPGCMGSSANADLSIHSAVNAQDKRGKKQQKNPRMQQSEVCRWCQSVALCVGDANEIFTSES